MLFEGSLDTLVACVLGRDGSYYYKEVHVNQRLQEEIFPVFEQVFKAAGFEKEPLKVPLIAAGCGPGSYTSVRLSVSAARALAQSIGCKILPLSSLEVLATGFYLLNSCVSGKIAVLRDAKMNQVYYQSFLFRNGNADKSEIMIFSVREAEEMLEREGIVAVVTDTESLFKAFGNARDIHLQRPNAIGLIQASEAMFKTGETKDWSEVFPVYLRLSYAEMKKKENGS